jgi:hypothetical protein
VKWRALAAALCLGLIAVTTSCGASADFCRALPGFDAAVARVDAGVTDAPFVSTVETRESIALLIDRVTVLREAAPRSVRSALGTVLAAYGQVAVAYEAVQWDPRVASGDDAVTAAVSALASDGVASAREELSAYAEAECRIGIDQVTLGDLVVPTTLPLPAFSSEPAADAPDRGGEENVLRAVGFIIAERYAIAVTVPEAECLGSRASESEELNDASPEATHEWTVIAFAECGIVTVPTTTR